MGYIFYPFAILAILYEITCVFNPGKIISAKKDVKSKKWDEMKDNYQVLSVLMPLYCLWTMVGLFTSQWLLFLVIIGLSLIPKKDIKLFIFIDAVLSLFLLLFIVINKFHLHYSMTDIVNYIVK